MATHGLLNGEGYRCGSGSGGKKQIEDESLEELERLLALAQEEFREMERGLQQRETNAVVVPLNQAQSVSRLSVDRDASRAMGEVTHWQDARCVSGSVQKKNEVEDESLEELERLLAVAQREWREMKESIAQERGEKVTVMLPEKPQSCPRSAGSGDASQPMGEAIHWQDARCVSGPSRRKEREEESLEELERQLAVAQLEWRQMQESIERERSEKRVVAKPSGQTQGQAHLEGREAASQALRKARDDQVCCDGTKLVAIQSDLREWQVPASNPEIAGTEMSGVALSTTQGERHAQSPLVGREMSGVDGQASNETVGELNQGDGVREDEEKGCLELRGHGDGSLLPGADIHDVMPADAEAVPKERCNDDLALIAASGLAATYRGHMSQLEAECGPANVGTGSEAAEPSPERGSLSSVDRGLVCRPKQGREPRTHLAMLRDSRRYPGLAVYRTRHERPTRKANRPSELRMPRVKGRTTNKSAAGMATRGRRALTADEGREAGTRCKQNVVSARTRIVGQRTMSDRTRQARVFDPGGVALYFRPRWLDPLRL